MAGIKVYVNDEVEERFRRLAMMIYGYGKGSLSKAAEEAFLLWIQRYEPAVKGIKTPKDPVGAIRGMLAGVKRSGVGLQHEAGRIREANASTKS